ncbi:MAG: histidine phosphatase family protein [Deltaproteobacteria bacterium]|nr:MAG: histidine phosphatase family protein [Deltaproteobacteria bacterium]
MTVQGENRKAVRLLFVRHGETESNVEHRYMGQSDSPLTPMGIAQARAVAKRLAKYQVDAIYSSDLGRAAITSRIISRACHLPVTYDKRLRERHAGLLQGQLQADARIKYAKVFAEIARMGAGYAFPGGGESGLQVEERLSCFLDEIRESHTGETVVVITHGGVLRVLLWHILGFPYDAIFRLQCDNTSISSLAFFDGQWILESWNDTAHLS